MTEANRFSPARCGRVSCSSVFAAPQGVALVFVRARALVAMAGNVVERASRVGRGLVPRLEQSVAVSAEIREVSDGLWLWRVEYPDWRPGLGWGPFVNSTCVASAGEVALLDPIAPPKDATATWERLDAASPTLAVVLKPDHVRSVDLFVQRYGARAFGPFLFWRHNIPETELEPIEPGNELPGGLRALYDGRGRNETPLWLSEQRALVFADALTAPDGELLIWDTPHIDRARAALRELLELPFEHVIVAHGEPVHDRVAYERALELPPYTE